MSFTSKRNKPPPRDDTSSWRKAQKQPSVAPPPLLNAKDDVERPVTVATPSSPTPSSAMPVSATAASAIVPPPPPWTSLQLACMNDAETNVLAIDIESVNPSVGPVRACGFVLVAYRGLLHYEVIDRVQFVVERSADEYGADGKRFWKEISPAIDQYYEHPSTPRLSPANAALHIRNYVDHCLATVPKLSILVDDPQTDHSLLYDFLKTHKQRPLSLAANGDHKKNLYVSRDLMRGSFSMIDRRFINLAQSDMYLYINRYWLDLVSKHLQEERISPPVITLNSSGLSFAVSKSKQFVQDNSSYVFRTQIGPDSKHVPVFDATQSLILWAKMEDIKRLFHHQLMKIAMMTPSVLVLPKPDDSAHVR